MSRLRSPRAGLQWSPGVLQKDALSVGTAGRHPPQPPDGQASLPAPAEGAADASLAPELVAEAEDHPALMTLAEGALGVQRWRVARSFRRRERY